MLRVRKGETRKQGSEQSVEEGTPAANDAVPRKLSQREGCLPQVSSEASSDFHSLAHK